MAVKIEAISVKLEDLKDKCLIIAFFEDKLKLDNEPAKFDNSAGNIISNAIKNKDFKAEDNEIKTLYINKEKLSYVLLLGLGKEEKFDLKKLMNCLASASKKARALGTKSFSFYFNSLKNKNFDFDDYLEKTAQAIILSLYQYLRYKTKDLEKIKKIENANIIIDKKELNKSREIVKNSVILAEAVIKTRDLVNTPPNIATPEYAANYAREIAKKNNLKCTILDEKEIERLGMECYMAVAKASVNKPRMVVLEYKGSNEAPIVLVGKGLTYDTGGINTKPFNYMTNMKDDKAGACSVIHVMEVCAKLKLKVNVVGIAAFAENSIAGNAYRPDDILKSYSGITVEVVHTDAEGRLVLADALSYSLKFKPKAIIDIATLTGASIIALGYLASPVVGNDDKLIDKVITSGEKSLDRVWQLPLWEDYEEIIKSDIADLKHTTLDTDAGVIIGGIFLKQFIKNVAWAHIDIGATVWAKQDKGYKTKGATGFGVLLLANLLKDWK